MRIGEEIIANRLQSQWIAGGAVKTIREARNDSLWVGLRSESYPSFVVKTKRGYSNPPAFCHFGVIANRFNFL